MLRQACSMVTSCMTLTWAVLCSGCMSIQLSNSVPFSYRFYFSWALFFQKVGSSAVCGPHTWKSAGSIDPLDPVLLRGPCCIVTVFGYKSEARTSNLQTETTVERLQHHRPLFGGGAWPPWIRQCCTYCFCSHPHYFLMSACMQLLKWNMSLYYCFNQILKCIP